MVPAAASLVRTGATLLLGVLLGTWLSNVGAPGDDGRRKRQLLGWGGEGSPAQHPCELAIGARRKRASSERAWPTCAGAQDNAQEQHAWAARKQRQHTR
eukprot:10450769-Alexandrium_andersonii.AAC.1